MNGVTMNLRWMRGLLAAAVLTTLLSSVPARAQSYYNAADGIVLADLDTSEYYVIVRGAKFWLPSSELYNFLNFWLGMYFVPHSTIESITNYPPDGTLVKERTSTTIYVISGERKWVASSSDDIQYYGGSSAVYTIPTGSLNHVGNWSGRNGIMMRERTSDAVYVLFRSTWFSVSSENDVQFYGGWSNVRVLPNGAISTMSNRPWGCGYRFRERSSGNIYITNDFGGKALITSPTSYDWANHDVVPDGSLSRFPDQPFVCMN